MKHSTEVKLQISKLEFLKKTADNNLKRQNNLARKGKPVMIRSQLWERISQKYFNQINTLKQAI